MSLTDDGELSLYFSGPRMLVVELRVDFILEACDPKLRSYGTAPCADHCPGSSPEHLASATQPPQ